MEYYLNEYSIRGQFKNTDDFCQSIKSKTIPVLDQVIGEEGSVIIKKDTFWQLEVCNGMTLYQIPVRKNERSSELFALKMRLIKLLRSEPHWSESSVDDINVIEYQFDKDYQERFAPQNCFTKAIIAEGRIISFEHPEYEHKTLKIKVKNRDSIYDCELDNITNVSWWNTAPGVKTWYIGDKYHMEVRTKEFEYHPPHFHISCGEYNAVYRLSDGKLYKSGSKKLPPAMNKEVRDLYLQYREELTEAWNILHPVF